MLCAVAHDINRLAELVERFEIVALVRQCTASHAAARALCQMTEPV